MNRFALLVVAAALAAPAAPGAYADPGGSTHDGECLWHLMFDPTPTGPPDTGLVGAVTATFAVRGSDGGPASATVTCAARVYGDVRESASAHGTGVVAFAEPVALQAEPTDVVDFCTTVDYDDATPTEHWCESPEQLPIPPDGGHLYLVDTLLGLLEDEVDPRLCPTLASLAPGVPGVLDVRADGDVWTVAPGAALLWDCPPYEG